jgi:hypothetical protein
MRRRFALAASVVVAVIGSTLAAPSLSRAHDKENAKTGVDAKTAFTKLKTLVGAWKSQNKHEAAAGAKETDEHPGAGKVNVTYKLTGAGSALVETQLPGSPHEMVTVYHLDGDDLRMTHYCAAQNQPRMKLDRSNSTADHLVFVFDGGSNLNPEKDMHIHGLQITFHEDGKVTSAWEAYQEGKKAGTEVFNMTRLPKDESPKPASDAK